MGTRYTLIRPGTLDYHDALELQRRVADGVRGGGQAALILLQHPPTYTLGARGRREHMLLPAQELFQRGAVVVETDRGGDITFHGPGQLVAYPILDLRARGQGPVWYVRRLEQTVIDALASFGIEAGRREGAPGVWAGGEKIAAIGVRISRGVTTHGFALNVQPDLSYFGHIIPCGIRDAGVTSMQRLTGRGYDMADVEAAVALAFARLFEVETWEEDSKQQTTNGNVDGEQQTTIDTGNDEQQTAHSNAERLEAGIGS